MSSEDGPQMTLEELHTIVNEGLEGFSEALREGIAKNPLKPTSDEADAVLEGTMIAIGKLYAYLVESTHGEARWNIKAALLDMLEKTERAFEKLQKARQNGTS